MRTVTVIAEPVERRLIKQKNALEARVVGEEFDRVRLAGLAVDELAVAHLVTRFLEQPQSLAQVVTHRLWIAADRIGIGCREKLGGDLVAYRFQDFQFAPSGRPLDASSVPWK